VKFAVLAIEKRVPGLEVAPTPTNP